MKYAYQSITFGHCIDHLPNVLAIVARAGFSGIEFSQRPDMIRIRDGRSSRPVTSQELGALLTEYKLAFLGIAGGTLTERMDFCDGKLDGAGYRIQPEYLYVEECTPQILARAAAKRYKLALHPHVFMHNHRLDDAISLLKRFDKPVNVVGLLNGVDLDIYGRLHWMPDTAHLFIVGDNPIDALHIVPKDRIAAVHLKDWDAAFGRSYHRYAKGFTELGSGDLGLGSNVAEQVIRELFKLDYKGWLVVEQDYSRTDPADSVILNARWLALATGASQLAPVQAPTFPTNWTADNQPGGELRARFTYELVRAQTNGTWNCYQAFARVIKHMCDCHSVTVWACSPNRDEMSLLAVEPRSSSEPRVVSKKKSRAGSSIERLAVECIHQQEGRSKAAEAGLVVEVPVMNQFNHHHIRFLVELIPRENWLAGGSDPPAWFVSLEWFATEMARTADVYLDDRCSYAASKVSLLAAKHKGMAIFLEAVRALIQELVPCEGLTIFLANAMRDRLECASTTGITWTDPTQPYYTRSCQSWTSRIWCRNEPKILGNGQKAFSHMPVSRETGPSVNVARDNLLFVPLVGPDGTVIGVVRCRNKRGPVSDPTQPYIGPPFAPEADVQPEHIFNDDDAAIVDIVGQAAIPHLLILLSDEQRARSVAKMTHELSVPMVAIRGCIDWLRRDLDRMGPNCTRALTHNYPADIDMWSELMLELLENASLIGYSTEPLRFNFKKTQLISGVIAPAIRQVAALLRDREFAADGIRYAGIEVIPALYIDRLRFQQLVFNLLSNAVKYAFSDPEEFQVDVLGAVRGNFYELIFRDWGPGITPGFEKRIFEENARGPESVKEYIAGQGIGLWVVQQITAAHGGHVAVTNNYRPTEFTVYLPISLSSSPPRKKTTRSRRRNYDNTV